MTNGIRANLCTASLRFLSAGGLTLTLALAQEVAKPDRDWAMIATIAAGLLVGLAGGAYHRISTNAPPASSAQGKPEAPSSCPSQGAC